MEELIKLHKNADGSDVASARELHTFLESKQDFSDWIKKRIDKYGFSENQDFVRFHKKMEANNATVIEYAITLDMAKELAMVEGNQKGKQARQYFIACEKRLREASAAKTPAELLLQQAQALVDYERKLSKVEEKVNYLIEDKEFARKQLNELPLSEMVVPEETQRSKVVELVNAYARFTRLTQHEVWNKLYKRMSYIYHINLKAYKKINREKTHLDVAERIGCMDKLHALISEEVKKSNVTVDYQF